MSRRFRPRKNESFARCPACQIRMNVPSYLAACSLVCANSLRAESQRQTERVHRLR